MRYSSDAEPGIRRVRRGRGFGYLDADGRPVRDTPTLERIQALAVPPAWTDVWICVSASGHVQATGRDARSRKVYRYHPAYRRRRDSDKYARLACFGRSLPRIRHAVDRDLGRAGLERDKVLALVVRLLELTHMRVGNDHYVRANRSFGLTTLRGRHAHVTGSEVRFRFRGKSGRYHDLGVRDRRLARMVKRCQGLPGQDLFQYLDAEGATCQLGSEDVNAYLRRVSGADITARDFRTWAGSVLALRELRRTDRLADAVASVARDLGNSPPVTRASYIHPAVLDAWRSGVLPPTRRKVEPGAPPSRAEELELIRLLERTDSGQHAPGDAPRGA